MPGFDLLSDNLRTKNELLRDARLAPATLPFKVYLVIHQVPFCFYVSEEAMIKELYDSYPLAWFYETTEPATPVFWYDSRALGFSDGAWEDEPSSECFVDRKKTTEAAVHRDFAATYDGGTCCLVAPYAIEDGFYNFLRWFMPIQFLGQNQLLLHSSCVLDSNKNAYFCLGRSGAGKTTIASLRPRKKILGDDMNVIKIEDGRCWAQAGALGQALLNPSEYAQWYPVKAILWLKKSERFSIAPMAASTQVKYLTTAVANLFWDNLTEQQALTAFTDINSILKINKMYELSFPIQRNVWDDVFQSFKEEV